MVDVEDQLRSLVDRPPAPPAPAREIARRAARRQRRRHLATAAAVATVAGLVIAVLGVRSTEQGLGTLDHPAVDGEVTVVPDPTAPGSEALRLAAASDRQPDVASADLPVTYTSSLYLSAASSADPLVPLHRSEQWVLGNGRRRMRSNVDSGRVLHWGAQEWEWKELPADVVSEAKEVPIDAAPPGGFVATSDSLAGLVVGGTAEERALRGVSRVYDGIVAANAAPRIRAGWYRLLAEVPGLQIEPNVRDHAGRTGTALRTTLPVGRGLVTTRTLIVDPATGVVLAAREERAYPTGVPPTGGGPMPLVSETDYEVRAVASAPPATVEFS